MSVKAGDVVVPGDTVADVQEISTKKKVILGPGLRIQDNNIVVCKAGVLKRKQPHTFWVDSYQKRYVPARGEAVIGFVLQKAGDIYRIDIGASEPASLSYLAFEGATKKNRPDVNVGDLVYGKLLIANKNFESELICVNSHGKKEKLGVLSGGYVFNCSINLIRKILNKDGPLFRAIQKEIQVPMEVVIGMNGRVWINAKNARDIIAIANAIQAAEYVANEEIEAIVKKVGYYFTGIK